MSAVVDQAAELLRQRKVEIRQEDEQIDTVLAAISPNGHKANGAGPTSGKPKAKRKKRKGERAEQAVRLICNNPGIGVADLAKRMKLKAPNYLYRVLPALEAEGRIKKEGKGYVPVPTK